MVSQGKEWAAGHLSATQNNLSHVVRPSACTTPAYSCRLLRACHPNFTCTGGAKQDNETGWGRPMMAAVCPWHSPILAPLLRRVSVLDVRW